MPIHVKKGTRKSIATIGILSGAEEIIQSWCQSWTLIAQSPTISAAPTRIVHLLTSLLITSSSRPSFQTRARLARDRRCLRLYECARNARSEERRVGKE